MVPLTPVPVYVTMLTPLVGFALIVLVIEPSVFVTVEFPDFQFQATYVAALKLVVSLGAPK